VGSKRQPRLSATAPYVSANPTGRGHHQAVLKLVARLLWGSRGSPAYTELPLVFRQLETLAPMSWVPASRDELRLTATRTVHQ
jgi:hypothetical protein